MKAAAILIVLLSNDGYWLAGRSAKAGFELPDLAPQAGQVHWALTYDDVALASGVVEVRAGRMSTVTLTLPVVRQRTPLRWVYRLTDAHGKEIESGEAAIRLFPDNLLRETAAALGHRRLIIWGSEDDPLAALLASAAIPHRSVAGADTLRLLRPDVVLVGPGAFDAARPEFRLPAESVVRGGATVAVFRQQRVGQLAGYPVLSRVVPPELRWQSGHPLLDTFVAEELESLAPQGSMQRALRLPPADVKAALAAWPALASRSGDRLDAMLVSRSIGKGTLVLCQLPFGDDWTTDPRFQLFLNALLTHSADAGVCVGRGNHSSNGASIRSELLTLVPIRGKP